jgi:hypothetical protein
MTKDPIPAGFDLTRFTGTESYYRHALNRNVVYTDGAAYVAEEGGAFWLLDSIALAQLSEKRVAAEEFQAWKLAVRSNRTATLTCEDGNYNVVYTQELEFTDFPEPGITLWFENNTIYLPSER